MPNTFSIPYSVGVNAAASMPLVDRRDLAENRVRFTRNYVPELDYANSLYVPIGREPTRGWILVRSQDYKLLNRTGSLYNTTYQLNIDECYPGGNKLTFQNLFIVQARCVSMGIVNDPNAIYLVELTDARGIYSNKWFKYPTNSYYNMPAVAYPNGTFYSASRNSGSDWTWSTLIGNLWGQMTKLGTYPGLPSTPMGTPENFILPGVSAWDALNDILDLLGFAIAVNPVSATPYTIVSLGAADATFTAAQTKYLKRMEDDLAWIDTGSGRVPGSVTVYFHRRNTYYGTEETVRSDASQWTTTPLYSVTINALSTFTGAVGKHFIWDDFTVRYDIDGSPVAADVTTAGTIAAERVQQYYNRIYYGTLGFMAQSYAGIVPFVTGSQCTGVSWRQVLDFEDHLKDDNRLGWRTEIVRGAELKYHNITVC